MNYTHYTANNERYPMEREKTRGKRRGGEEGRRGGGEEGRREGGEDSRKARHSDVGGSCEPSDKSCSDKHQGIWVACMSTLARQVEIERENFPDVDKLCLPILSSDLTILL